MCSSLLALTSENRESITKDAVAPLLLLLMPSMPCGAGAAWGQRATQAQIASPGEAAAPLLGCAAARQDLPQSLRQCHGPACCCCTPSVSLKIRSRAWMRMDGLQEGRRQRATGLQYPLPCQTQGSRAAAM